MRSRPGGSKLNCKKGSEDAEIQSGGEKGRADQTTENRSEKSGRNQAVTRRSRICHSGDNCRARSDGCGHKSTAPCRNPTADFLIKLAGPVKSLSIGRR